MSAALVYDTVLDGVYETMPLVPGLVLTARASVNEAPGIARWSRRRRGGAVVGLLVRLGQRAVWKRARRSLMASKSGRTLGSLAQHCCSMARSGLGT